MYRERQFITPAIVLRLIFMMGSLSIFFETFRATIQLYPVESGRCLEDRKYYKNRIQLLCANSDPMDTIVQGSVRSATRSMPTQCQPRPTAPTDFYKRPM